MGSKLVDLPMKLLMPSSLENIKEIAFKTIPSVSKVEIKRVLESMYGFEVEKVRTLNMQGKKKRRGAYLISRPNYKKAYITLKNPISIASDLFLARSIEEEKRTMNMQSKSSNVDKDELKSDWLDSGKNSWVKPEKQSSQKGGSGICSIGTLGKQSSHEAASALQDVEIY